jgi:hypothetical protein
MVQRTAWALTTVARVGEIAAYAYCGQNTSDVDLEVVRVVDDRFGALEGAGGVDDLVAGRDAVQHRPRATGDL